MKHGWHAGKGDFLLLTLAQITACYLQPIHTLSLPPSDRQGSPHRLSAARLGRHAERAEALTRGRPVPTRMKSGLTMFDQDYPHSRPSFSGRRTTELRTMLPPSLIISSTNNCLVV
jgi:hypothetical protein